LISARHIIIKPFGHPGFKGMRLSFHPAVLAKRLAFPLRAPNQAFTPLRSKLFRILPAGGVLFEPWEIQTSNVISKLPRGIAIFARLAHYGNFPFTIFK
jgi:hypothetical protein